MVNKGKLILNFKGSSATAGYNDDYSLSEVNVWNKTVQTCQEKVTK